MAARFRQRFMQSLGLKEEKIGDDPVFIEKVERLDDLHKILFELHEGMELYLTSLQALSQASSAISRGLAKLADSTSSPIQDVALKFQAAHITIERSIRVPATKIAKETALRETSVLLSRIPPIYRKIGHRRKLRAEQESLQAKVRAEPQGDDAKSGAERRRLAASLDAANIAVDGITDEVAGAIDQLQRERGTMLVPQVSSLVGCEAFFFKKSSEVLERLSVGLPQSALALCRLARPTLKWEAGGGGAGVDGSRKQAGGAGEQLAQGSGGAGAFTITDSSVDEASREHPPQPPNLKVPEVQVSSAPPDMTVSGGELSSEDVVVPVATGGVSGHADLSPPWTSNIGGEGSDSQEFSSWAGT